MVLSNLGSGGLEPQRSQLTLGTKIRLINWGLVLLICTITGVGVGLLYSAAGGHWKPWAQPQLVRAIPGLILMLGIALVDIRHLMKSAYVIFFVVLCLLIAVELMGRIGMGAQRCQCVVMAGIQGEHVGVGVEGHGECAFQVGVQRGNLRRQARLGLAFGPQQLAAELAELCRLALAPDDQFAAQLVFPALEGTPDMAVRQVQRARGA